MVQRLIYITVGLLSCLVFNACDKSCKTTVQEVVTVQNLTGRQLSLTFCKHFHGGEAQVTLSQDRNLTEVELGSRAETRTQGGPGACQEKTDQYREFVTLSSKSRDRVKICHDDTVVVSMQYIIVEPHQACPTGMIEETNPGC